MQVGHLFVTVSADASGVARGLSKAERAVEQFGSRMFFMGSRITAGVTLPILGLTRSVVQFGMALDEAMSNSVAIMGEAGDRLKNEMADTALELSKTSKFTGTEIAKGYYDLASAGLTAEEALQSIGIVTTFAQAGLMNMGTAGEYLAGAVAALGPELVLTGEAIDGVRDKEESMAKVADLLTMANNKALGTVEDFANALTNKAAAAMRMYNIRAEEGIAALMVYASQNIKGKAAGQQLWMVLRDLQMATFRATEGWKKYGISVYDATGKMRPLYNILEQMEAKLSGMSDIQRTGMFKELGLQDRSRAALQVLIGNSAQMKQYLADLAGAGGEAARVAARQMEAVAYKWEAVKNRMKAGLWEIWKAFAPIILNTVIPVLEKFGDTLADLGKKLAGTSETTRKFILGMIGIVAAVGPVIAIMGSMTLLLSAAIGPWAKLISYFYKGSAAFKAAELALEDNKAKYAEVIAEGGKMAKPVMEQIKLTTAIASAMRNLGTWLGRIVPQIIAFRFIVASIGPAIQESFGSWDSLKNRLLGLTAIFAPVLLPVWALVDGLLAVGRALGMSDWQSFTDVLRSATQTVNDLLVVVQYGWVMLFRLAENYGAAISELWNKIKREVPGILSATLATLRGWATTAGQAIATFFLNAVDQFKAFGSAVAGFLSDAKGLFQAFGSAVGAFFTTAGNQFATFGSNAASQFSAAWQALNASLGRSFPFLDMLADKLRGFVATVGGQFAQLGTIIAQGFDRALAPVREGWRILDEFLGLTSGMTVMENTVADIASAFGDWIGIPWILSKVRSGLDDTAVGLGIAKEKFKELKDFTTGSYWANAFMNWAQNTSIGQAIGLLQRWKNLVADARAEMEREATKKATTAQLTLQQQQLFGLAPTKPVPMGVEGFLAGVGFKGYHAANQYRNPFGLDLANIQPFPKDDEGAYPPAKLDSDEKRYASLIKQQRDMLMGIGDRTWQATVDAFRQNRAAVLGSAEATERLYEAYKKVRDELDELPQDIEAATQKFRDQDLAMTRISSPARQMVASLLGEDPVGAIEKIIPELERELESLLKGPSIFGLGGETREFNVSSKFLEQHRTELGQLSLVFDRLSPHVQEVVRQYRVWAAITDTTADKNRQLASVARNDLTKALSLLPAQIADAELELEMVRVASEDRTLKNLSKGWNEQNVVYMQSLVKRMDALKYMDQETRNAHARDLADVAVQERRRLDIIQRTDMERMANTIGANKAIMLSFKALSNETVMWYLKMKTSWYGFRTIATEVASAFTTLAKVFDKSGKGLLTWIANLTTLSIRARDVGTDIGVALRAMDGALRATRDLGELGSEAAPDWEAFAAAAAGAFVAIANGIQVMDEATNSISRMRNAIGGATAGFQMGQAIAPGWGGAIGAIIGGLIGAFRGNPTRDAMNVVGQTWGVDISEGLAQVLSEQASRFQAVLSKGSVEAAAVFNWEKIVEEAGGLTNGNVVNMLSQLNKTFDFLNRGMFTSAEAIDVLTRAIPTLAQYAKNAGLELAVVMQTTIRGMADMAKAGRLSLGDLRQFFETNFAAFKDSVLDFGKVASKAFLELLALHGAMGVSSFEVLSFIGEQAERAGTAWLGVITAITGPLDALSEALEETKTRVEELIAAGEDSEELVEAQTRMNDLLAEQKNLATALGPELERMGGLILATVNAAVKQGLDWSVALNQVGGALDALISAWDRLGITSENVALNELIRYRNMMNANQALFQGVYSLSEGVLALSYLGGLTQDTFDALQAQGLAMYTRMQSAAEQAGGTTIDALRPMVPYLTAMRDAAAEYGLELDANTKMLIDQATELGLLKPKTVGLTDTLITGFENLTTTLDGVKNVLEELKRLLSGMTSSPYTIDVRYNVPNPPEPPEPPPTVPGGPDQNAADVASSSDNLNVTLVMPDGDVLLRQVVKTGKKRGLL